MPQALTYRPIESADCQSVVQLHRSSFENKDIEASIFVSQRVEHYLAQIVAFHDLQQAHWLWGAWQGDELVGYVFGRALPASWHLNYLAVSPEYQGHGIGQEMWGMWYRCGQERNYHAFTVDVEEHNDRARTWYERMGYCSVDKTWIYREELNPSELGKTSENTAQSYQLLNWENAQAWQEAYGFSQFELAASQEKWVIGRMGAKYFRVNGSLPQDLKRLLHQLDASRNLLVMSQQQIPELTQLKVSLRLRCDA